MEHGKSIFSRLLCKELARRQQKTLLIDFDTYNQSISTIYNVFNKKVDYEEIRNNIIKISNYENLLFVREEFVKSNKIFPLIKELEKEYDEIIIDTGGNYQTINNKRILEVSDEIIFVIVPNAIDLKKAIKIYEILRIEYNIPNEKIKIAINKVNKYSIDILIIREIFKFNEIKGEIKYNDQIEKITKGKDIKINL